MNGINSVIRKIMARFNIDSLNEDGMTTAELLGNAALAIAALVGIWLLLQQIGIDVMTFIRDQIGV